MGVVKVIRRGIGKESCRSHEHYVVWWSISQSRKGDLILNGLGSSIEKDLKFLIKLLVTPIFIIHTIYSFYHPLLPFLGMPIKQISKRCFRIRSLYFSLQLKSCLLFLCTSRNGKGNFADWREMIFKTLLRENQRCKEDINHDHKLEHSVLLICS